MYNPQIKYALDTVREVHATHAAELAWMDLMWEYIYNGVLENGEPKLIQIVPRVISQFKG